MRCRRLIALATVAFTLSGCIALPAAAAEVNF
jgi:starvation-inducible outer membrane lipoprotein